MHRTKSGAWITVGMGFALALINAVQLWGHLRVFDWLMIALLLAAPPGGVWSHLKGRREITDDVWATTFRLGIGGYVPLWFGLGLARRMLNG